MVLVCANDIYNVEIILTFFVTNDVSDTSRLSMQIINQVKSSIVPYDMELVTGSQYTM